jgi:hypothetical protein
MARGPPRACADMIEKSRGEFFSINLLVRFDGRAHAMWCPTLIQNCCLPHMFIFAFQRDDFLNVCGMGGCFRTLHVEKVQSKNLRNIQRACWHVALLALCRVPTYVAPCCTASGKPNVDYRSFTDVAT